MEFTSDLEQRKQQDKSSSSIFASSTTENEVSSSDSEGINDAVERSRISEDELKKLELIEKKNELLEKRNQLLTEVNQLERESVEMIDKANKTIDKNALDVLNDLLSFSQKQSQDLEVNKLINGESLERLSSSVNVHGDTSVDDELKNKYDSLPLLNMKLRLKYLSQYLYKDIKIIITSNSKNEGSNVSLNVELYFQRFENITFSVTIKIVYDEVNEVMKDFTIISVSDQVRLAVQPLLQVRNPSFFLLACFEFDKIRQRRFIILRRLRDKFIKRVKTCELPRSGEYILLHTHDSLKERDISLRIDFQVFFEARKLSYSPFPTSRLTYELKKNGKRMLDNMVENIADGLIKEYGVEKGLEELCNACLFADLYKH
ncbi:hypothetical protein B1J92_F02035g [Nakaseomyces glabratus]|nr:hypothetical protein B1J91_F02035g [Nakaseomyces glabratus]OXB48951.1 hypothetical protein B1J92_F02035g [Nakaseomyces glabratus]